MCRKSQIFPEDCLQYFSLNTNILRNKETLDYLWKENLKMLCQRTLTLFAVLCLSLMTSSTSLTDMHWCLLMTLTVTAAEICGLFVLCKRTFWGSITQNYSGQILYSKYFFTTRVRLFYAKSCCSCF